MTKLNRSRFISLLAVSCVVVASACQRSEEPAASAPSSGAAAPTVAGAVEAPRRVFVSNYVGNTVSVIEGDPEMETKAIAGFESPHGIAIQPTGQRLVAVAEATSFGVKLVDPRSLEIVGSIDDITSGPQDLEFSPDGKTLYVLGTLDLSLNFIDMETRKVSGEKLRFEKKPRRIKVDPSTGRLYILLVALGDGIGAEVIEVDPATKKISRRAPVEKFPTGLGFGNNRSLLVSASFDNSTLTVVDAKTMKVLKTIESETGIGLVVHPSKPIAYSMVSFDNEIDIVDLDSGETIKKLTAGQWPTHPAFDRGGRYLYVPHEESDSVAKLDTETNEVVMKIAVGQEPIEVAVWEP